MKQQPKQQLKQQLKQQKVSHKGLSVRTGTRAGGFFGRLGNKADSGVGSVTSRF